VHLATYARPGALLFLLGAGGLVLLALVGLRRGSRVLLVLAAAVLAVSFAAEALRIADELRWESNAVYGCDEPLERCVPFVAPAIRDLQDDIRRGPEARDPEFQLLDENGFRARGALGWWLVLWTSIVLAGVMLYRAFLLALRPVWAVVALGVCTLGVLAYLLLQAIEKLE
jgi:hypothetical protein